MKNSERVRSSHRIPAHRRDSPVHRLLGAQLIPQYAYIGVLSSKYSAKGGDEANPLDIAGFF